MQFLSYSRLANKLLSRRTIFEVTRCISYKFQPQDVSLRRSNADDYDSVMKLGRYLFDGMDYLPYTYHSLLGDASWTSFVMEKDGEVISFYGSHMISNGKSLMSRGGRVASHMQRHGIMTLIEQMAVQLLHHEYPHLETMYGTVKSTSPFLRAYPRESNEFLFSRSVVGYKLSHDNKPPIKTYDDACTEITKSEMSTLFQNVDVSKRLFPKGHISVRWSCLRAIDANLDFIYRFSQQKYVTYSSDNNCQLLTLAVHFRCPAGYVYHMECYGDTSLDILTPHLKKHIEHARKATPHGLDLYFYAYTWEEEFELDKSLHPEMVNHGFNRYPLDYTFYLAGCRKIVDVYRPIL